MVRDFIICLLAFFNIFIYDYYLELFFLFKKKRGVQKGVQKRIQKGVQKGGSTICLHPLTCLTVEHRKLNWEKNPGWPLNNQKCVSIYAKGLQNHVNFEPVKSLSSKYQACRFQEELAK